MADSYIVPVSAQLGPVVTLPVKVDPGDPALIAIDWDNVATPPQRGHVRPVGESRPGGDALTELERLGRLRDSGVLTDAEFSAQKAKILG